MINRPTGVERNALVDHGKPDLVLKVQTVDAELIVQTRLIGALQKAGTEGRVDLHRGVEDSTGDVFVDHRVCSSVSPVSSVVERFVFINQSRSSVAD